MRFLINLLISTLTVLIAAYVLPGVEVTSFMDAFVVAIILGVANAVLRPLLLLLTLPITILTLGLFTFVINAFIILIVNALVPGFAVASFWWALLFSIILSLINSFLHSLK